jgi:transposase
MDKHSEQRWVGLDVSDERISFAVLDRAGSVERRGTVRTAAPAVERQFRGMEGSVMVIEVGTHSPWLSRLLARQGHRVIVANPRYVRLIGQGPKKSDRQDAENLARLARADEQLLHAIVHRGEAAQAALEVVRARDHLVGQRTATINHIRAAMKSFGERLPSCSSAAFARRAAGAIPAVLWPALGPLVEEVARLNALIQGYDRLVEQLCREQYPETGVLRQVTGVGALTALTYVLVLEERGRFAKSRQVGAYLGLTPRLRESGEQRPQQRISRAGDALLRRLLVQCAHYILGPFGKPSALREQGQRLAERGSKKRAVVAIARKLAVLLHRLWVTGEVYEPFPRRMVAAAA